MTKLTIFDSTGRLVFSQEKNLEKGPNQIEIPKENFPAKGVFFYQLETLNRNFSGKILFYKN